MIDLAESRAYVVDALKLVEKANEHLANVRYAQRRDMSKYVTGYGQARRELDAAERKRRASGNLRENVVIARGPDIKVECKVGNTAVIWPMVSALDLVQVPEPPAEAPVEPEEPRSRLKRVLDRLRRS